MKDVQTVNFGLTVDLKNKDLLLILSIGRLCFFRIIRLNQELCNYLYNLKKYSYIRSVTNILLQLIYSQW